MTEEEIEQIEQYEWDKFCRRFPHVTSHKFMAKVMLLFTHKGDIPHLLWQSGFRDGWLTAFKRHQQDWEP